jgi:hypothetical protein
MDVSDFNIYAACVEHPQQHTNQCIRTVTISLAALACVVLCDVLLIRIIRTFQRCFSHRSLVIMFALIASLYVHYHKAMHCDMRLLLMHTHTHTHMCAQYQSSVLHLLEYRSCGISTTGSRDQPDPDRHGVLCIVCSSCQKEPA